MGDKKFLVCFVGIPGSGKTCFAKQLATALPAVTFNSDAIRLAIWGSRAVIQDHRESHSRVINNQMTFGVMDYMTGQVLAAGYSVVYDCNANRRTDRKKLETLAHTYGAQAVVVQIETPYEVALERTQTRESVDDQVQFDKQKAEQILQRFKWEIELPTPTETVVHIDGQASFEAQWVAFKTQLKEV